MIGGPRSMAVGRTEKKSDRSPWSRPLVTTRSVNRIASLFPPHTVPAPSTPSTLDNRAGHSELVLSNECEVAGSSLPSRDRRK